MHVQRNHSRSVFHNQTFDLCECPENSPAGEFPLINFQSQKDVGSHVNCPLLLHYLKIMGCEVQCNLRTQILVQIRSGILKLFLLTDMAKLTGEFFKLLFVNATKNYLHPFKFDSKYNNFLNVCKEGDSVVIFVKYV